MRIHKKFLSSVAAITMLAFIHPVLAYETTRFSVDLSDSTKTGTISINNDYLGDDTLSIDTSTTDYTYNYVYQYFTPTESGTYVFGQLSSPADSNILLYANAFDPANPNVNYVALNDDGDVTTISDAALQTYVSTEIASRDCDSDPDLCPLLTSTLTAGVDYYIVVSTYIPGASLGNFSESVSFFVIGNALVGVGGVPPAGYVAVSGSSPVSGLANYLDQYDNSGQLAGVATYLDTASEDEVVSAIKTIFPVNTSFAPQAIRTATGQTATVLIDKVGTVLGGINAPTATAFHDGSFDTGAWLFGDKNVGAKNVSASFTDSRGYGGSDDIVTNLASVPYQKYVVDGRAFWVQGVGAISNAQEDAATNGFDTRSAGVVSGYEVTLSEDVLVGLIASAFRSTVDLDNDAGDTDANVYSLGVYGQHLLGSIKLTGVFLGSYSDYDSKRNVNIGGITGTPEADYSGWGTSTTLSASKLFEHDGTKIEPFVSANYSTASTDSYTETNGGVFNMNVSSDTSSTASAKTGVTVQRGFDMSGMALELKAKPYVGYQWELNEASNSVRISGGSTSVVMAGRDINKGQVGLALDANLKVTEQDSFKIGIDYSHDKDEDAGLAYVGYGVKF